MQSELPPTGQEVPGQHPAIAPTTVQGTVDRLVYHDASSGYSVARLKLSRAGEPVTIVGLLLQPQEGQILQVTGVWREHPKYGRQLQIQTCEEVRPTSVSGLEQYLASGLIQGVGKKTAKRIVDHFGEETLTVLDTQIERLQEVAGIAPKRIRAIQATWQTQTILKDVMIFLQNHGVSTSFALKIFQEYGPEAIQQVSDNPYRLVAEIPGIGFMSADAIARSLGMDAGAAARYRSGILQVFREATDEGHCFLLEDDLIGRSMRRLALPGHRPHPEALRPVLSAMLQEKTLNRVGENAYYMPRFFQAEQGLAQRLKLLLSIPLPTDPGFVAQWLQQFSDSNQTPLSPEQRQAVELAASHRVVILTGLPGTGKTFTTRAIVGLWQALGKEVALASPTGRAAQRLSEMTGEPAKTIHRLLEIDPKTRKFQRHEENPIPATAIVVDEVSMLDLLLGNALIQAIGLGSQLLLVGDTDQLPSVGPGNVLRDLIASGCVPVVRLTQIFRQAQASAIITNAHAINQGQLPHLEPVCDQPQTDCLWLAADQPERGVQGICDLLSHLIPQLGFNPKTDVQVLSPMLRATIGTQNLNHVLQTLLNPPSLSKPEIPHAGLTLRQGDRVLQRVNNYNREVFNGDLGIIAAIDPSEQLLLVKFSDKQGDRLVEYPFGDLDELTHAYAMTIHKSQGSEYPVVILPIYLQHAIMLNRNLIYTGLTRARQMAIFVGPQAAIQRAIQQTNIRQRNTLLAEWLR